MRELGSRNKELLLVDLHRVVEHTAAAVAEALLAGKAAGELAYPPNGGLTEEEGDALAQICGSAALESGIRKVLAHVAARPLYHLFCVVDGIADPEGNGWSGVSLLDKQTSDAEEFLHTEFLDKYWLWRRIRPDKGWTLDTWTRKEDPEQ
jgi:hypothetical protein